MPNPSPAESGRLFIARNCQSYVAAGVNTTKVTALSWSYRICRAGSTIGSLTIMLAQTTLAIKILPRF